MHCLWGLQQQGYQFELKGGTSLSKGFGIIERFSEDIDIQIHPTDELKIGQNHNKKAHIEARRHYFDSLTKNFNISGLTFYRDHEFDDKDNLRSAGIRGEYKHKWESGESSLKDGVLLEVGFDQTTPYVEVNVSSWAFDKVYELGIDVIDNRAINVKCYLPEYTFVEKLQTISTKFRRQQAEKKLPKNFIRNYYDVFQLLNEKRVLMNMQKKMDCILVNSPSLLK